MTQRKKDGPEVEVSQQAVKTESEQPQVQLIYVGPNLPGGRLMQYTVFRGGVPEYLTDLFEKQPAIRQLIVPVRDLAAAQAKTGTPGTLEHALYQQVKDGGR
ncbi:hypothetical protein [Brevibacillus parabrevis]|uniref:Uncharacterized protein n=1 Tax=Brevibacillus parabrevis TaxID=54914 RepID=A0A4Y3PTH1_BREPA|nr:hypothetical protein [Brevibacillus parabrevis]RNB94434.1 hypothetical protein EDM60_18780 [Brevibacillus parabrevis]GEB35306.1 hypothetical protein BPA01_48860 [Brevibacillus parabrevis]